MKNKIVIMSLMFGSIALSSQAQEISKEKVPEIIKSALTNAYPKAKDVEWDKEGKGYEASFENGNEELSVVLDAKGKIIETEKEIEFSALPDTIKMALKGKTVSEAAIITKNGKTFYEAEVEGKDLIFDTHGKPAKL
jgi:uncharacterized membrane protein YkoI